MRVLDQTAVLVAVSNRGERVKSAVHKERSGESLGNYLEARIHSCEQNRAVSALRIRIE